MLYLKKRKGEKGIMNIMHYDVLIAGAGAAGTAAAISAARTGKRTALIERYGTIGGGMTSMYVRPFLGSVKHENIGREIVEMVEQHGKFMNPIEAAKTALAKLLFDAGVDVYMQTQITAAEMNDRKIEKVYADIHGKRLCFTADAYIDATGDGDLSVCAGQKYEMGREGDRLLQPLSIMFTITGIKESAKDLYCCHEEDYRPLPNGEEYLDLCHKACESGELPPSVNIVRLYPVGRDDARMVNATQYNKIDPLNPTELFTAEYELRKQVEQVVNFLKNNIPGFENIYIEGSCSTVGVRETRRILGDYVITAEDMIEGKKFEDAVVHNAHFHIDIHNPAGAGQSETDGCPHTVQDYDIPYRCLCPIGADNLLTAGRCISGTHRAHASYRVMNICMAMGNAAGIAAAMMSENKCMSREISVPLLQKRLDIFNK